MLLIQIFPKDRPVEKTGRRTIHKKHRNVTHRGVDLSSIAAHCMVELPFQCVTSVFQENSILAFISEFKGVKK